MLRYVSVDSGKPWDRAIDMPSMQFAPGVVHDYNSTVPRQALQRSFTRNCCDSGQGHTFRRSRCRLYVAYKFLRVTAKPDGARTICYSGEDAQTSSDLPDIFCKEGLCRDICVPEAQRLGECTYNDCRTCHK